jgi:hypothetical protein
LLKCTPDELFIDHERLRENGMDQLILSLTKANNAFIQGDQIGIGKTL